MRPDPGCFVVAGVHSAGGHGMGPRSDNRGHVKAAALKQRKLQASMGPRSDNRGYETRFRPS
jgi:hypothetical protein